MTGLAHIESGLEAERWRWYRHARAQQQWDPVHLLQGQPVGEGLSDTLRQAAWQVSSVGALNEQTGMVIAAQLLTEFDDPAARYALATAVSDEARHSEAFALYATRLEGSLTTDAYDVADPLLSELFFTSSHYQRLAIHGMLESLALDQFTILSKLFSSDPLGLIYDYVKRDEARHVGMQFEYLTLLAVREEIEAEDLASWESVFPRIAKCDEHFIAGMARLAGWSPDRMASWFSRRYERRLAPVREATRRRGEVIT
jgi:hypothetical protein